MSAGGRHSVRRYGINAISNVATSVLQITVLVWVNQYLLKRVSAEEFSLLPLVTSLLLFGSLAQNVFVGGISRYIVEADARQQKAEVTSIASSMAPMLGALALCLALAGTIVLVWIEAIIAVPPEFAPQARLMFTLLLVPMCIGILLAPFSVGLYVRQRFVQLNVIDLACEILRVAIVLGLLFGVSTSVLWLTLGSAVAALTNLAAKVWFTRRLMPEIHFERASVSRAKAKTLISFGGWVSIGSVSQLVTDTLPVLLLGHLASAVDVASFHLGRLVDKSIRRLAVAAMAPAEPVLTSIYAVSGTNALTDLYFRGGRYHLWATLAAIAPLVVFNAELATLYAGATYLNAGLVLAAFVGIYPVLWASAMFYRVTHASGQVRLFYECEAATLVVASVAMYVAVGPMKMGAVGAALGLAVPSTLVHLILIWPRALRLVGGTWSRFARETLVPGLLPFAVALAACLAYQAAFDPADWWSLGMATVVSLLGYVAAILLFCLDPTDRGLLDKSLAALRGHQRA